MIKKIDKTKLKINIDHLLEVANKGPSRWELDNIIWHDRTNDPKCLVEFLTRIKTLEVIKNKTDNEQKEYNILCELANELDESECLDLLSDNDEIVQQNFIETLARQSALEVLTRDRVSLETMNLMCKLNPSDFILTSKRTQDIINSVHELVIQGETLSNDVAGA
jgi:hypothetical protein